MKLQSEFLREFLKNNFRPFAAPSKCRQVRPAPPSLLLCIHKLTSRRPNADCDCPCGGASNSPIYRRSTSVHFGGPRHRLAMFHVGRWNSGIIIRQNSTSVWKRKCQTTTMIYNIWFQDVTSRYTQAKLTYIQESYGAFDVYHDTRRIFSTFYTTVGSFFFSLVIRGECRLFSPE